MFEIRILFEILILALCFICIFFLLKKLWLLGLPSTRHNFSSKNQRSTKDCYQPEKQITIRQCNLWSWRSWLSWNLRYSLPSEGYYGKYGLWSWRLVYYNLLRKCTEHLCKAFVCLSKKGNKYWCCGFCYFQIIYEVLILQWNSIWVSILQ